MNLQVENFLKNQEFTVHQLLGLRKFHYHDFSYVPIPHFSAVFSGGVPPEFWGSQKGQSLISAYQSLAITTNTPGFEKLNTALETDIIFKGFTKVKLIFKNT